MAKTWTAKDPDAILDYEVDWSDVLPEGDDLATGTLDVLSGSASVVSTSLSGQFFRAIIQGGADGESAVFLNTVTSVGGLKSDETIVLPIISSTLTALTGYEAPTAAHLQARFPAFADVTADVIAQALTEAESTVDESWAQPDFALGRMLWAAHVLTLDGLGTGGEAQAFAQGLGGYQRMKSGSLELQRFDKSGGGGPEATSYGKRWLDLAKRNRGGPLVIGSSAWPCSPLAYDCG